MTKRRKRDIEERRMEALNSMWTGRTEAKRLEFCFRSTVHAQLPVFEAAREKGIVWR